jgi:1-deoxyxylulose-5-phosphate synthase
MNRREFMRRSSGIVAGTMAASLNAGCDLRPSATSRRLLGSTGVTCTFLGIGTGTVGYNGSSDQTRLGTETLVSLLEHAYARGLRYFDLADDYGSHSFMREALKGGVDRRNITISTKTMSRDADTVRSDIERYRTELDTDVLDIVLLHYLTWAAWPEDMAACMDVLSEAKARGVIRAHGVSCHGIGALARVPDVPWVDVVLAQINPFGARMEASVEDTVAVLQRASANGQGVLGMKIVGEGQLADRMGESIKFAVDAGYIDAITIGFLAPEELDQAIGYIEAARMA